jgi:hypothetical protein
MIKTFESFNKSDSQTVQDVLQEIELVYNHSSVGDSSGTNALDKIVADYFKGTQMINWFEPSGIFLLPKTYTLSLDEKFQVVKLYEKLNKDFHLNNLPDIDDVDEILIPISHLTDIEMTIFLNNTLSNPYIRWIIDTNPGLKINSSNDENRIDLDKFDEIFSEVKPSVGRIKDLGYGVDITMNKFNDVILYVSK